MHNCTSCSNLAVLPEHLTWGSLQKQNPCCFVLSRVSSFIVDCGMHFRFETFVMNRFLLEYTVPVPPKLLNAVLSKKLISSLSDILQFQSQQNSQTSSSFLWELQCERERLQPWKSWCQDIFLFVLLLSTHPYWHQLHYSPGMSLASWLSAHTTERINPRDAPRRVSAICVEIVMMVLYFRVYYDGIVMIIYNMIVGLSMIVDLSGYCLKDDAGGW